MSELLDRPIFSGGSTLSSQRPPSLPDLWAAEMFYTSLLFPRRIHVQLIGDAHDGAVRTRLAAFVEHSINALLQLPPGWDRRRAKPPTEMAAYAAVRLVLAIADDGSLPPQVIPLPDGGLQLEWHAQASVEIEVDAGGAAHLLVTDHAGTIVINDEMVVGDEELLARARESVEGMSARLFGGS